MGGAVPKRWRSVWCMLCAIHVSARLCRRHRQALTLAPTPCDHHTPGLPALSPSRTSSHATLFRSSAVFPADSGRTIRARVGVLGC